MIKPTDILNGFPYAAALLDPRFRVTAMNSHLEALCGYTSPDVHEIAIWHVIRTGLKAKDVQVALDAGQSFSKDGDIINADRKKLPIRFTFSPLKDSSDHLAALLVVLEDISFLQELDKKAHAVDLARSIIGHSPGLQEIFELVAVWANTDATLLITGETGTGKDLLAEAIHRASKRAKHPFIKVNCGAIPESLLESELFGSIKGAYTGAHADKPGMFRLAQGGTIFLTEIGDLPLQLQVKLLTVLDDREFYPLGSSRKVSVDVRIITGTHRNLKQLVQEGKFRQDLFFRLNVLRAHLPPLRDRQGDIPLLLDHFLQKICGSLKKDIKGFNTAASSLLETYPYPGNIRELRNIVEYAVNMCRTGRIDLHHLPASVLSPEAEEAAQDTSSTPSSRTAAPGANMRATTTPEPAASWTEMEKKKILSALINNDGNRSKAAQELGWGRSTLWRKIKQYGIG